MVRVSVIVPAHNEEGSIKRVIERLSHVLKGADYELVIVNDGSTDRTRSIVERMRKKDKKIRLVNRKPPNGFGLAIKDGIKYASGKVIVFVMADLCDDLKKIPDLVRIIDSGYDIGVASRFIKGGGVEGYSPLKLISNRLGNEIIRIFFQIPFHDITNAFKAYRADMLKSLSLKSDGFEILAEIFIKLWKKGAKVKAIPTVWKGRTAGTSKMKLAGSGLQYLRVILSNR
jgi:glycosyltransferase involved in cell wall biosynthesis